MWCDNCLLVLPLRAGAIAWNAIMVLYSAAGGYLLVTYGQYWYFLYPEYFIYGGVSFAVAALTLISILAYANRSFVWTRAMLFCWPIVLVLSAIRGILMIYQLNRRGDYVQWECDNGGQLWTEAAYNGSVIANATSTLPTGFCSAGVSSFQTAMFIGLAVDLVFQLYAAFLQWRFSAFLSSYQKMQGPNMGYYA